MPVNNSIAAPALAVPAAAPLETSAPVTPAPVTPEVAADVPAEPRAAAAVAGTDAAAGTAPDANVGGRAPAAPSYLAAVSGRLAATARVGAALAETQGSLVARREAYGALIAGHEQTIATLEAELATINRRIAEKTGEVRSLLDRKQRLVSEIASNQRMAAAAGVYGGILGLFTFGASAAVGAGIAATAGVAIIKLRADLADAERSEASVRADLRALEAAGSAHAGLQAGFGTQLASLRTEHAALAALAPALDPGAPPRAIVAALQAAAAHDERVIANLESQIAVLQAAKAEAGAYEHTLDEAIARLKQDVADLSGRLADSRRTLYVALIDVALIGFGATPALRREGIDAARKQVLLAGLDLAQGDSAKAASALVGALLADGLVGAAGSAVLAHTLGGLLAGAAAVTDHRAAIEALVAAVTRPLSAPQRAVLELLAQVTAFDPEPLARAVIELRRMSRAQADAVTALLARGA